MDLDVSKGARLDSAEAQRDGTLWRGLPQHRM